MRVDERVRKSVVFIGAENSRGFSPYGTALVGLIVFGDFANTVLVTAHHVIDDIPGDRISVRVNRRDGSADTLRVEKKGLIGFRDRSVDMCVFPITLDPTIYDFFAIQMTSEGWEKGIQEFGEPEPGDEVCVVGLYTTHYGHIRNMPVVRIGHIAAIPDELVMTDRGFVAGYLIECHSLAGLSGSPVYWSVPRFKMENGNVLQQRLYLPLGILIGHHVIETREDEIVVPQFQQAPDDRKFEPRADQRPSERPTGFSVVLPINHIFRLFESEELMSIFRRAAEAQTKNSGFRPSSAAPPLAVTISATKESP